MRRARREALTGLIVYLFRQHKGTYGSPRIHADLVELGWAVSKNTVAAVMAELSQSVPKEAGPTPEEEFPRCAGTTSAKSRWDRYSCIE